MISDAQLKMDKLNKQFDALVKLKNYLDTTGYTDFFPNGVYEIIYNGFLDTFADLCEILKNQEVN